MRKLLALLLLSAVLFSCKKDNDNVVRKILYVAPQKGTYTTWFGTTASSIQVKENMNDQYVILGQDIEGFDYVEGFEYRIEVNVYTLKDPPADASDKRYILKRIISKEIK